MTSCELTTLFELCVCVGKVFDTRSSPVKPLINRDNMAGYVVFRT